MSNEILKVGGLLQFQFSGIVDTTGSVIGGDGATGVDMSPVCSGKQAFLGPEAGFALPNSYPVLYWDITNTSSSGVLRAAFGDAALPNATLLGYLAGVAAAGSLLQCVRIGAGVSWSDFPRDGAALIPRTDDSILRRRGALALKSESGDVEFSGNLIAWIPD